jgi:hypothetical protein
MYNNIQSYTVYNNTHQTGTLRSCTSTRWGISVSLPKLCSRGLLHAGLREDMVIAAWLLHAYCSMVIARLLQHGYCTLIAAWLLHAGQHAYCMPGSVQTWLMQHGYCTLGSVKTWSLRDDYCTLIAA